MPKKISDEDFDNLLRRVVALHDEQRPRGDQLEIPDVLLLTQLRHVGMIGNQLENLELIKRTLSETPRLVRGRWLSYDPGISCVTIESVPTPERLEWLAEKLKLDFANRLEARIRELSWDAFEQFVRDFVEGSKGISIQRTGKSHDGGVDFLGEKVQEDELSLPLLIVGQAKRWKRKATRDDVAAFIGNVDMKPLPKRHGPKMGIYISCSGFTDDAKQNAPRASIKLALWDARDLASMMLTRRFGIKNTRIDVPVWDESFWNDYK